MSHEMFDRDDVLVSGFPELEIPLIHAPSERELARRRASIDRARKLREEIGPIEIATDDLLHLSRQDPDE